MMQTNGQVEFIDGKVRWHGGPIATISVPTLERLGVNLPPETPCETLVGKRIPVASFMVLGLEYDILRYSLYVSRLDGWWRVYGYTRYALHRMWRFLQYYVFARLFMLLWIVGLAYHPGRMSAHLWYEWDRRYWMLIHPVRWVVTCWQAWRKRRAGKTTKPHQDTR